MLRRGLLLSLAVFSLSTAGLAQQPTASERLAGLARAWGFIKFHHPHLAYKDLDWDSALVSVIPLVSEGDSLTQYRAAIRRLLSVLEDPLTRVVEPASPPAEPADDARAVVVRMTDDSTMILAIRDYYGLYTPASGAVVQGALARIPHARAVVIDLRSPVPVDPFGRGAAAATLSPLLRLIASADLVPPGERRRVFVGYPAASPFASGQYRTGFLTTFEPRLKAAAGARAIPSVFIVNAHAPPPPAALALQAQGTGSIVFEGDPRGGGTGSVAALDIAPGVQVEVRVSEPVHPDGTSAGLVPDVRVEPSRGPGPDRALAAALALAGTPPAPGSPRAVLPAAAPVPVERSYPTMGYPAPEYRLLGLFRLWATVQYFYPYKDLLDEPWDSILPEFIPRFQQATSDSAYALAIAQVAVRLHDSHAYVAGSVYTRILGEGYPPIRVRVVEGEPVVTALFDSTRRGLEVGDVIQRVDGEDAGARLARYQQLISASTPQSSRDKAAISFMNGPVGSEVRLQVRGASERVRSVVLPRRREDFTTLYHRERSGDIIRVLPGNVGYVDLDRLSYSMVDSMFRVLQDTRAIIFDMRGYPQGTFWVIAPWLATGEPPAARLETPMVNHGSPGPAGEAFSQHVPPRPEGLVPYRGRTVMLIDERTQSQAEHTGMFFRAANGTRFVGGPTAGANGELASVSLPGGVTVGFTGQSVRFPDGRQLQRIGLVPDLLVVPTIRGIRAGQDEVLNAALRLLGQ